VSAEDNVKTIKAVYEAFGRGDLPAILDAVSDDVDWASDAESTEVPWWGVHRGKDQVSDFFVKLATATDTTRFDVLELMGEGDVVLAVVRFGVTSKTTGRHADMNLHHYWKFRDDKITYYRGAEDTLLTLRTVID
jgi:ketosteroid isomerase-like protein